MQSTNRVVAVALVPVALLCATAQADVVMETVPVGNPGNANDGTGYGGVAYAYNIGKYEVTAGQYTEFLNAVADDDTYGLYSSLMWSSIYGCKIQQSGSSPNYTYSVDPDRADRPVNYVSWYDTLRFANWMHNGQGSGDTENGSYDMTQDFTSPGSPVRNAGATWVLPSEDEWYKAAYYKGGGTNAGYWDYPTSSDSVPGRDMYEVTNPGNNANYYGSPFPIDSPYYTTVAGEFELSDSPYGTFDQGGNIWEWIETLCDTPSTFRGVRGGSFYHSDYQLDASKRGNFSPTTVDYHFGFRVSEVPEPCPDPGDSGNYCTADVHPNNGDGIWDHDDDGDCIIDVHDLGELLPNYRTTSGATREDGDVWPVGNGDGAVDVHDLGLLLAQYGDDCSQVDDPIIPKVPTGAFKPIDAEPLPEPPAGMVLIPGGEFEMGDTFDEGFPVERPVHAVYVSPYYIDTCEVTNAQYAAALNWAYVQGGLITVASGGVVKKAGDTEPYCDTTTSSGYSRITWNGSTFGVEVGKEDHPMVMVSWYGSVAYANWRSGMEGKPLCYDLSTWACNFGVAGYRLPTEAEWEKAARGGVPRHRFPWSDTDTIQHARANYYSFWFGGAPYYPYDTNPTEGFHPDFDDGEYPHTSSAGYFAPNSYGLYDMAGNVGEWCHDWHSSTYYSSSPGSNPTGPASGTYRVLRDGDWFIGAAYCRCASRPGIVPDNRYMTAGFRLALDSP